MRGVLLGTLEGSCCSFPRPGLDFIKIASSRRFSGAPFLSNVRAEGRILRGAPIESWG
jgi:hypothetical protein